MRTTSAKLVTDTEGAGDEVCACGHNHDLAIGSAARGKLA